MITQAVKLLVRQSSGEKYKRTQQGASAKLESYLYCYMLVYTITLYLPHVLLKATILHPCALISSTTSFYHILSLITSHHVICHVTVVSHASLSSRINQKEKKSKINMKSEK